MSYNYPSPPGLEMPEQFLEPWDEEPENDDEQQVNRIEEHQTLPHNEDNPQEEQIILEESDVCLKEPDVLKNDMFDGTRCSEATSLMNCSQDLEEKEETPESKSLLPVSNPVEEDIIGVQNDQIDAIAFNPFDHLFEILQPDEGENHVGNKNKSESDNDVDEVAAVNDKEHQSQAEDDDEQTPEEGVDEQTPEKGDDELKTMVFENHGSFLFDDSTEAVDSNVDNGENLELTPRESGLSIHDDAKYCENKNSSNYGQNPSGGIPIENHGCFLIDESTETIDGKVEVIDMNARNSQEINTEMEGAEVDLTPREGDETTEVDAQKCEDKNSCNYGQNPLFTATDMNKVMEENKMEDKASEHHNGAGGGGNVDSDATTVIEGFPIENHGCFLIDGSTETIDGKVEVIDMNARNSQKINAEMEGAEVDLTPREGDESNDAQNCEDKHSCDYGQNPSVTATDMNNVMEDKATEHHNGAGGGGNVDSDAMTLIEGIPIENHGSFSIDGSTETVNGELEDREVEFEGQSNDKENTDGNDALVEESADQIVIGVDKEDSLEQEKMANETNDNLAEEMVSKICFEQEGISSVTELFNNAGTPCEKNIEKMSVENKIEERSYEYESDENGRISMLVEESTDQIVIGVDKEDSLEQEKMANGTNDNLAEEMVSKICFEQEGISSVTELFNSAETPCERNTEAITIDKKVNRRSCGYEPDEDGQISMPVEENVDEGFDGLQQVNREDGAVDTETGKTGPGQEVSMVVQSNEINDQKHKDERYGAEEIEMESISMIEPPKRKRGRPKKICEEKAKKARNNSNIKKELKTKEHEIEKPDCSMVQGTSDAETTAEEVKAQVVKQDKNEATPVLNKSKKVRGKPGKRVTGKPTKANKIVNIGGKPVLNRKRKGQDKHEISMTSTEEDRQIDNESGIGENVDSRNEVKVVLSKKRVTGKPMKAKKVVATRNKSENQKKKREDEGERLDVSMGTSDAVQQSGNDPKTTGEISAEQKAQVDKSVKRSCGPKKRAKSTNTKTKAVTAKSTKSEKVVNDENSADNREPKRKTGTDKVDDSMVVKSGPNQRKRASEEPAENDAKKIKKPRRVLIASETPYPKVVVYSSLFDNLNVEYKSPTELFEADEKNKGRGKTEKDSTPSKETMNKYEMKAKRLEIVVKTKELFMAKKGLEESQVDEVWKTLSKHQKRRFVNKAKRELARLEKQVEPVQKDNESEESKQKRMYAKVREIQKKLAYHDKLVNPNNAKAKAALGATPKNISQSVMEAGLDHCLLQVNTSIRNFKKKQENGEVDVVNVGDAEENAEE